MNKKINIAVAEFNGKELLLKTEEEVSISELKPMEQMLVDSDHFSFIYIVDMDGEYTYLVLPDSIWSEVNKAHAQNAPVYLTSKNERLLLEGFHEELSYLIENIKGNSNYGEEMVTKVESTF